MKRDIVYVEGRRFMVNGEPIVLRGLGVGSWLNLEHFMMGVPGWDGELRACLDRFAPGFMKRFTETFFTAGDAAYLRSMGVNLIRVPINHHLFWDDERDEMNPFGFAQLERVAAICREAGLYFLPDLHTTPGGQNPDWHSECRTGAPLFWEFKTFQRRAAAIWGAIAAQMRNEPALLGYDLLNEPALPDGRGAELDRFYREAVAAVRAEDPDHIVFLEGDRFSMDFSGITPPEDDNWAYTYHFYPGVWDERLLSPEMDDDAREKALAAALEEILASMKGYELSRLSPDFGLRLTRDTLRTVERRAGSWCLWCYKDARFMGLVYPAEESDWMRLARKVQEKWDHHRASRLGQDAVDAVEALCPYQFTSEEKNRMQYILRAVVAHTDVPHILAPALEALPAEAAATLAESFALERCEKNAALEALLRRACAGGAAQGNTGER
jgi:endoglucanase